MKPRILFASICLFACTACVGTPGYEFPGLKGEVLDSTTMAPIPSASVSVTPFGGSGLTLSSVSDAAGRYEIGQTKRHFSWSFTPAYFTQAWVDAKVNVTAQGYAPQQVPLLDIPKRPLPDMPVYLVRQ
jgi:hypothetical protein